MEQECHICGGNAVGEGFVEGAKVFLCDQCASYSKKFKPFYVQELNLQKRTKPAAQQRELVNDYAKRISDAREKKCLTREELGKRTAISHQEIIGFEEGRLKPVEEVAKKLEYALGIKLLEDEQTKPPDLSSLARENTTRKGEPSLADVVVIKKKK